MPCRHWPHEVQPLAPTTAASTGFREKLLLNWPFAHFAHFCEADSEAIVPGRQLLQDELDEFSAVQPAGQAAQPLEALVRATYPAAQGVQA